MQTTNDFFKYSNIAKTIFEYMNGKINRLNSNCFLNIEGYDFINNTTANIRYPNTISIFIGNAINSWKDEYSSVLNKDSYICTVIAWSLAHELFHADQLLSMLQYNSNSNYKQSIEYSVETASYYWVLDHSNELEAIIGIPIIIDYLESSSLKDKNEYEYRNVGVKEFYLQTIANIVLRDFDLFAKLKIFTNDSIADDITIEFNNTDSVLIKKDGEYLLENVNAFSELVYKWAGYYDMYTISAQSYTKQSDNGKSIGFVKFNISNNFIKPIVFKEGHDIYETLYNN